MVFEPSAFLRYNLNKKLPILFKRNKRGECVKYHHLTTVLSAVVTPILMFFPHLFRVGWMFVAC